MNLQHEKKMVAELSKLEREKSIEQNTLLELEKLKLELTKTQLKITKIKSEGKNLNTDGNRLNGHFNSLEHAIKSIKNLTLSLLKNWNRATYFFHLLKKPLKLKRSRKI